MHSNYRSGKYGYCTNNGCKDLTTTVFHMTLRRVNNYLKATPAQQPLRALRQLKQRRWPPRLPCR
jgi:hypothetical protein